MVPNLSSDKAIMIFLMDEFCPGMGEGVFPEQRQESQYGAEMIVLICHSGGKYTGLGHADRSTACDTIAPMRNYF